MDGREAAGGLKRYSWHPVPARQGRGIECRCACGWAMRYDDEAYGRAHAVRWHQCPPPLPPPDEETDE